MTVTDSMKEMVCSETIGYLLSGQVCPKID